MGYKVPKAAKRKQKLDLQRQDVSGENQSGFSKDFQSQLTLVLRSPQGKEIRNRNWRVSDKYRGGRLIERQRFGHKRYDSEGVGGRSRSSRTGKRQLNSKISDLDLDRFEQFVKYSESASKGSKRSARARKKLHDML